VWIFKSLAPSDVLRGAYSRHLVAAAIAATVWAASKWGLLSSIEGVVYDWLTPWVVATEEIGASVVLVRVDDSRGEDEQRETLAIVERLTQLGARAIAMMYSPPRADGRFFEDAAAIADVTWGLRLERTSESDGATLRLPREARWVRARSGVVDVPSTTDGICRALRTHVAIEDDVLPTIEVMVARKIVEVAAVAAGEDFLIRFRGGAGSLPLVNASDVLDGSIIPQIVAGKVVLVGRSVDAGEVRVATPTTSSGADMSALEFHGQALNSLLEVGAIRRVAPVWQLSALVAIAVLSCAVYQRVEVQSCVYLTVIAFGGAMLAAYTWLAGANCWIPLAELLVVQTGVFVYALETKASVASQAMTRLLLRCSERLRDRHFPESFSDAKDHWPLVLRMVDQTLDLSRVVFLERAPGSPLLREAASLRCSVGDIGERRRDIQRDPYLTALETGEPVRVEQFLNRSFQAEEQMLVPLAVNDECVGFWAFGIEPSKRQAIPGFDGLVRRYASVISQLVWQRSQENGKEVRDRTTGTVLRLGQVERAYRQLEGTVTILGRKLGQAEALLNGINTAAVVYDLFGRVLHINRAMQELLQFEKLDPQKSTALDLISAVSDYDVARSRRILRHVIVENQTIAIPVTLSGSSRTKFLLHLRSLEVAESKFREDGPHDLVGQCVLVELVDTSSFAGLFEMKEKLTARLGLQLRNDLAAVDLSSSILGADGIPASQRTHIAGIVHDKVAKMMDVLVECQQYLTMESSAQHVERFPVDVAEFLDAAILELDPLLARRRVRVEVVRPKVMSYVLASTTHIDSVFSALLRVLLSDALDDSVIVIEIVEGPDVLRVGCANQGFGVPNERFQEYVYGEKVLATEELKALREVVARVDAWGGELVASSELGRGTRFDLQLVKFL